MSASDKVFTLTDNKGMLKGMLTHMPAFTLVHMHVWRETYSFM